MLTGESVALRARIESDVAVLHEELYGDVPTRSRADNRAWRPIGVGASPFAVNDGSDSASEFSVVETATDELAGEAVLWAIDRHNRCAHVGLALRPSFRGRGLAVDALRVLVEYGLSTLGLNRVQLETSVDNAAMIAAAGRAGFRQEGRLRHAAWANGAFVDQLVMSVLVGDRSG